MKVAVIGPVEWWWQPGMWHSLEHRIYIDHREDITVRLVEAGHLVYRPDRAFKGAWDESMQAVNDLAISLSDVAIDVGPVGVPGKGTDSEICLCMANGVEVFYAPPGDTRQVDHLLVPLDDPYAAVRPKLEPVATQPVPGFKVVDTSPRCMGL